MSQAEDFAVFANVLECDEQGNPTNEKRGASRRHVDLQVLHRESPAGEAELEPWEVELH